MNKKLIKIAKGTTWIITSIMLLLLLIILLIRTPSVQQMIVDKAENYLIETLQTKVSIDRAYISFPKNIEIENFYIEDQKEDTLLYIELLKIDTDLWDLFYNKINLKEVEVHGLSGIITIYDPDSTNFNFIINSFASTDSVKSDQSTTPWEFDVNDLVLSETTFRYNDFSSNKHLSLKWALLETQFDQIDFTNNTYSINQISLKGSEITFLSKPDTLSATAENSNDSLKLNLQVQKINISHSNLDYQSSDVNAEVYIGKFSLKNKNLDIGKLSFDTDLLSLEDSRIDIEMNPSTDSSDASPLETNPSIKLSQLSLKNNQFRYDIKNQDSLKNGFDPNHLKVDYLNADIRDILVSDQIAAEINTLSFNESDGFTLENLKGKLAIAPKMLSVNNFSIATERSEIGFSLVTEYESFEKFISNNNSFDLEIKPSNINAQDVAYFSPDFFDSLNLKTKSINIKGKAFGSLDALVLKSFQITAGSDTEINASGTFKQIISKNNITFENTSLKLKSTYKDLKSILPDSLLPTGIRLPSRFVIEANASGRLTQIVTNSVIQSSFGNASVKVNYDETESLPQYNIHVKTTDFNIGKLLQLDSILNNVKINLRAKGKGTSLETADLSIKGKINNIDYKGYSYDEVIIDAKLSNRMASGEMAIDDKNLKIKFDGSINMTNELYHYKTKLDIIKAQLDSLQLSRTPLDIKGSLVTDLKTKDFKKLDGNFGIKKFSVNNGIDSYKVDSLLFASIEQDGITEISIDSDIAEGRFKGNIDFAALPKVVSDHIDQYYDFKNDKDSTNIEVQFTFNFDLKNTDLLTEIILPELSEFHPGRLEGSFDSKTDKLSINMNINHMKYTGITLDSVLLQVQSDPKTMESQLSISKVSSANTVLNYLNVEGILKNNKLKSSISLSDSTLKTKYLIKGLFESLPDGYSLKLDEDSLMFNYELWSIADENLITFNSNYVEVNNFIMANNQQQISFTKNGQVDSLLRISFSKFNLKTISSAIQKDEGFLKGTVNGSVDLSLPPNDFTFNTDLSISDFHYLDEKWGDLKVKLINKEENIYQGNVAIKSNINEAQISGTYDLQQSDKINAKIIIPRFDLTTLAPITAGAIDSLSGTISGNATIQGTFTKPMVNGSINITESWFNPSFLNNGLSIKNETININDSKVVFDNFTVKDRKNNKAVVDGHVIVDDFKFYYLNLSLKTDDFLVMNTTEEDNQSIYGQLRTSGKAIIKGSSIRPDITMNLEVSKGSQITYIVPETEYAVLNHENIVKFINHDKPELQDVEKSIADSLNFQGIKLNANLGINDKSSLTIIVDPITKDKLFVQGNAALTLAMNRKGDVELSGRYDLTKGTYDLSFYKLVKRAFNIENGSSITWTGDIFEAQLDVKARHTIEAAPIDLVVNQISNTDQQELNKYRQKLPFLVYLDIKGKLLQPEINFEIDMPENKRNSHNGVVYARIRDLNTRESDLNKQVFALLILKRFIADNPLQSEGGYNLEDNARRSVSRILSDQLNRLTDNINGVNLNFNLESYQDFSSGNTESNTQLELGISKTLFNDRLEVRVAGNVNIEGQQQQNFSDYVGDLVLEYKLTEDGRLRVTGFRRSDVDIINGEIIATGAGIIYIRDYNSFKELFKSRDQE